MTLLNALIRRLLLAPVMIVSLRTASAFGFRCWRPTTAARGWSTTRIPRMGPLQENSKISLDETNPSSNAMSDLLHLQVGGRHYEVEASVLRRFPESFFARMLNAEWKVESSEPVISIQRDGTLFKLVYDYMFYGKLPRDEHGVVLIDLMQIKDLKEEADFYNLPGLIQECHDVLSLSDVEIQLQQHERMSKLIKTGIYGSYGDVVVNGKPGSLISLLRLDPVVPTWVTGTLEANCNECIFKSTTVQEVNVDELIQEAQQSPFGRGSETVVDTKVRDSLEIPASKLADLSNIIKGMDISSLAPHMKLKLKPYKLVVYREGGHFDNHRDTVRDERHIGTLVLVLNSNYTGGELEISHGDHHVLVTGVRSWVAMYGDCVHSIHPVTSGTRVTLIFDIWNEANRTEYDNGEEGSDNDGDENGEEELETESDRYEPDHWFWPDYDRTPSVEARIAARLKATPMLPGAREVWNKIYKALDKDLKKFDTVSICLEHLYPACQANLDFLKGGDYVLYNMLKDKYRLGVTPITIARIIPPEEEDDIYGPSFLEFAHKGAQLLNRREKNILIVPHAVNGHSTVHHVGVVYNGNDADCAEYVYLVAALVIRKLN